MAWGTMISLGPRSGPRAVLNVGSWGIHEIFEIFGFIIFWCQNPRIRANSVHRIFGYQILAPPLVLWVKKGITMSGGQITLQIRTTIERRFFGDHFYDGPLPVEDRVTL